MNREIKFRAFGKNSKEFLTDGKTIGWTLKQIQNIVDIDGWIFSQFTGLHDKNGREIYEGDILTGSHEVQWEGAGFILSGIPIYDGWTDDDFEEREVIGNIYESKNY